MSIGFCNEVEDRFARAIGKEVFVPLPEGVQIFGERIVPVRIESVRAQSRVNEFRIEVRTVGSLLDKPGAPFSEIGDEKLVSWWCVNEYAWGTQSPQALIKDWLRYTVKGFGEFLASEIRKQYQYFKAPPTRVGKAVKKVTEQDTMPKYIPALWSDPILKKYFDESPKPKKKTKKKDIGTTASEAAWDVMKWTWGDFTQERQQKPWPQVTLMPLNPKRLMEMTTASELAMLEQQRNAALAQTRKKLDDDILKRFYAECESLLTRDKKPEPPKQKPLGIERPKRKMRLDE